MGKYIGNGCTSFDLKQKKGSWFPCRSMFNQYNFSFQVLI